MADEQRDLSAELQNQLAPEEPDWRRLIQLAGKFFRPTAPINVLDVFSGRESQITRVCDVVLQDGQHAVLFGERGVGKTSLANVLSEYLVASEDDVEVGPIVSPRVNCDVDDTFDSVWRKILKKIYLNQEERPAGFNSAASQVAASGIQLLPAEYVEEPNPKQIDTETVRVVLTGLGDYSIPILIVDEFDRLLPPVRRVFADLIKTLSDHVTPATVVLVGVADSVDGLLEDHQSIARAVVQVNMPRMTLSEIWNILFKGARGLGMKFDREALSRITAISQGLPHYAHLLGLNASRVALRAKSLAINAEHVRAAIRQATNDAQQSVQSAYYDAIRSAQPGNLFADVLLACAIAEGDELGHFKAQDVRGPMRQITGKEYEIPNFAQHLHEFSSEKRGCILRSAGGKRRLSYHFKDPLMQPFVIMQGEISGRLPGGFFAEREE
jgi:Cdc6-like AAA superfamily ATPase